MSDPLNDLEDAIMDAQEDPKTNFALGEGEPDKVETDKPNSL